jgi:hypothetical protein
VEVKIGVQDAPKEISLETDESPEAVRAAIDSAVKAGGMLALDDDRGRTILVPAAKIAYVEIGPSAARRVGFGH